MNFKKKALSATIAAAATMGGGVAHAGTWTATSVANGGPRFAAELFGSGNTAELNATDAEYKMASGVAVGAAVIDITLTGGTWGTALTSASLSYDNTNNAGTNTISLVDGGTTTDSTAQFRVAQGIVGNAADTFTLAYTIAGADVLSTASTTAGPTLAFAITDVLGSVDTAGAATVVASSVDAVTVAANTGSTNNIDVTNGSTVFTDGTTTATTYDLGDITITDTAGAAGGVDSGNISVAWTLNTNEAALEGGSITITGDFGAALALSQSDTLGDANTATNDGLAVSGCLTANATTLTADTATFVLSAANVATAAGTACDFTMTVDGTTLLSESAYTAAVAIDYTQAGTSDEAFTGSLSTINKNGSSVVVPLLLNPDGAYDNFVRITNGGSVDGKVFVILTNDSGDTATGTLLDGADLAAGNSADLISVATLVEAAQAADATFSVGSGKLRATIEGEFSGIAVQNISVSTDGTTFFTF